MTSTTAVILNVVLDTLITLVILSLLGWGIVAGKRDQRRRAPALLAREPEGQSAPSLSHPPDAVPSRPRGHRPRPVRPSERTA